MNRREFLQCAAVLVSGASVSHLGLALSDEQLAYLATAPDYASRQVDLFSDEQRRIVAAMAEAIIPRTETPGAIDAGVPRFIEVMVAEWFNEEERAIFKAGLIDMETRVPMEHGQPFYTLEAEDQLAILEAMEESASGSPWYSRSSAQMSYLSDVPFICHMKELTAWGFFTSQAGCQHVLRYDPMPMRFDGDVARDPNDSAWAHFRF